jgi:hypothetical protein
MTSDASDAELLAALHVTFGLGVLVSFPQLPLEKNLTNPGVEAASSQSCCGCKLSMSLCPIATHYFRGEVERLWRNVLWGRVHFPKRNRLEHGCSMREGERRSGIIQQISEV